MIHLIVFLASATIVVWGGVALARFADAIAAATGIGRLWVGSVLLAAATSLPELVTGVAAIRMGAVDLAVGDLFGSSLANMLILASVDLLPPRRQVLAQATYDHALAASLAICLNAVGAALVFVRVEWTVLGVTPGAVLLAVAYVFGTRAVYRHAVRNHADAPATTRHVDRAVLRSALRGFGVAALVVLLASPALAWSAEAIAATTGLGNTFVGTWLVGLATSLPELVASLGAVRMGAFDLAVGNLFGSNAFNMALMLPLDIAQPGSLFAALGSGHVLSGLFAVVLMGLGLAAIVYRAKRQYAMLEPGSFLMLCGYAIAMGLLYATS